MSALPPKADMCSAIRHVCYGPVADIPTAKCDVATESTRLLVVVGFTELRFDARASIAERYLNIKVRRFLESRIHNLWNVSMNTWPIHLKGIGNSPRPNAIRVRVNTAPTANELQYKNGLSFRLIVDPPLR